MSLNKLPLLDAEKIKGVEIDDSAIADLRALVFRSPSGKIEYVDLSGGGDMLKEVYDTDLNNIIDNAEKLAGYTLAEVRDHTLDIAKITGIVPVGQGGLGKTFVPSWLNDYIIVYNLSEDRFEMVAKPEAGGGLESCVEVSAGDMSDLQSKVANYWGSKKIIVPNGTYIGQLVIPTTASRSHGWIEGASKDGVIIQGDASCEDDAIIKGERESWRPSGGVDTFTLRNLIVRGSGNDEKDGVNIPFAKPLAVANMRIDGTFNGAGTRHGWYHGGSGAGGEPATIESLEIRPTSGSLSVGALFWDEGLHVGVLVCNQVGGTFTKFVQLGGVAVHIGKLQGYTGSNFTTMVDSNVEYGRIDLMSIASSGTPSISELLDIQAGSTLSVGVIAGGTFNGNVFADINSERRCDWGLIDLPVQGTYKRVDFEVQSGEWANPSGTFERTVIVYNSTQSGYRLYTYVNGSWHYVALT